MDITRSNYEIWLTDLLDGKLSKKESEEVFLFLSQNPDLREEFDDLDVVPLKAADIEFNDRRSLIKTPSDIDDRQFDLLCAAHLENDLSKEASDELNGILSNDTGRKKTFDLIHRMRLRPLPYVFKNKESLLRKSPLERAYPLFFRGIAAAAVIFILVLAGISIPRIITSKNQVLADNYTLPGNNPPVTMDIPVSSGIISKDQALTSKKQESRPALIAVSPDLPENDPAENRNNANELIKVSSPVFRPAAENITEVSLTASLSEYDLMPTTLQARVIPDDDEDDMTNVGRFLAKTIREKILKKDAAAGTPVRAYEIAEAGISGINKLLGWQMALNERNDETGRLTAVSFSSKLVSFNAPVKKSSSVE